jgi:hypothetical protein
LSKLAERQNANNITDKDTSQIHKVVSFPGHIAVLFHEGRTLCMFDSIHQKGKTLLLEQQEDQLLHLLTETASEEEIQHKNIEGNKLILLFRNESPIVKLTFEVDTKKNNRILLFGITENGKLITWKWFEEKEINTNKRHSLVFGRVGDISKFTPDTWVKIDEADLFEDDVSQPIETNVTTKSGSGPSSIFGDLSSPFSKRKEVVVPPPTTAVQQQHTSSPSPMVIIQDAVIIVEPSQMIVWLQQNGEVFSRNLHFSDSSIAKKEELSYGPLTKRLELSRFLPISKLLQSKHGIWFFSYSNENVSGAHYWSFRNFMLQTRQISLESKEPSQNDLEGVHSFFVHPLTKEPLVVDSRGKLFLCTFEGHIRFRFISQLQYSLDSTKSRKQFFAFGKVIGLLNQDMDTKIITCNFLDVNRGSLLEQKTIPNQTRECLLWTSLGMEIGTSIPKELVRSTAGNRLNNGDNVTIPIVGFFGNGK